MSVGIHIGEFLLQDTNLRIILIKSVSAELFLPFYAKDKYTN